MPNYVPPADKANGQTLDAVLDWNAFKNALASYFNNGGIGNAQISSNPAEKIDESKLNLTAPTGNHHTRHEPGGADEVQDIDILNTGTPVSAHASRHASGGADPLPAGSISPSMLQTFSITDQTLLFRKNRQSWLAKNLGLTLDSAPNQTINLNAAGAQPAGNGVVRSGKVYFACVNSDLVVEVDFNTSTVTDIAFVSGDDPRSLLLVGTDIYVLCSGSKKIKKIAANNSVTTVISALNVSPCDTNMDYAEGLCPNADGTIVFISYKVLGQSNPTHVARVALTGGSPGPTHDFSSGSGTSDIGVPYFIKRGATEQVVFIDTDGTGLLRRRLASDLSAVDTLVFDHNRAVYDGQHLVVLESAGANVHLIDPFRMKIVSTYTGPGGSAINNLIRDACFFDGRACYFGGRGDGTSNKPVVARVPVPQYGGGVVMLIDDLGSAEDIGGFATDGQFLYVSAGSSTVNSKVHRLLL